MRQVAKTVTHRFEVTEEDYITKETYVAVITVTQVNGSHVTVTCTEGGKIFSGNIPETFLPKDVQGNVVSAIEAINKMPIDRLYQVLDPFGVHYQHIEPATTIEVLTKQAETKEGDFTDRIQFASQFSTLAYLNTQCNDLMIELFGYNWISEVGHLLLGKSTRFKTVQRLAGILKSLVE